MAQIEIISAETKLFNGDLELYATVASVPEVEHRYEQLGLENYVMYYSEVDELVSFFAQHRTRKDGFGGAGWTVSLKNGEKAQLEGPWSSRPGVLNSLGFGPCTTLWLATPQRPHHSPYHVTLEFAERVGRKADVELDRVDRGGGEFDFEPNKASA